MANSNTILMLGFDDSAFDLDQCTKRPCDQVCRLFPVSGPWEDGMDDSEVSQLAARLVQKIMESANRDALAQAIAKQMCHFAQGYASDMQKLGERLESRHS